MTAPCTPCQARAAALAAFQAQHHAAGAYQSAVAARDAAAQVAGRTWVMTGPRSPMVEITGADLSQLFPAGTAKAVGVVGIPAAIVLGVKFLLHAAWPGALIAGAASVPLVWGLLYKAQFGGGGSGTVARPSKTLSGLVDLAMRHGFPDPQMAAAIAMAESGGNPCAQGDPHGPADCSGPNGTSTSFGLWQIHVPAHPEYGDGSGLLDPDANADAAYKISSGGTNWTPWSTYNSGAYLQYYPQA